MEIDGPAATVDVLVMEDDRLIRELLGELLESAGYHVTVAKNGTEGARRLREASADVGIVVMSASFDSENNTRGDDGCHLATLAKPFTLEELTATISQLVTVDEGA